MTAPSTCAAICVTQWKVACQMPRAVFWSCAAGDGSCSSESSTGYSAQRTRLCASAFKNGESRSVRMTAKTIVRISLGLTARRSWLGGLDEAMHPSVNERSKQLRPLPAKVRPNDRKSNQLRSARVFICRSARSRSLSGKPFTSRRSSCSFRRRSPLAAGASPSSGSNRASLRPRTLRAVEEGSVREASGRARLTTVIAATSTCLAGAPWGKPVSSLAARYQLAAHDDTVLGEAHLPADSFDLVQTSQRRADVMNLVQMSRSLRALLSMAVSTPLALWDGD